MTCARSVIAAALLLAASRAAAVDQAACGLYPAIGYPKGEDADFFTTQGGVPNIVFLLDNSGSINRMAPDGAAGTWGTQGATYGCQSPWADKLAYFSPCGLTAEEGKPYSGSVNYGDIAKVCPYLDTGNKVQTGAPGFDPDYYCVGGGLACSGHENFFDKNYVFHDNDLSSNAWSAASCDRVADGTDATGCKGFEEAGPHPAATTVAGYCNAWLQPSGVTLTATELSDRRASCNSCLANKGYWFSGYYYKNNFMANDPTLGQADGSPMACGTTQDCVDHAVGICVDRATRTVEYNGGVRKDGLCRFPHLYFTGNFLNFHPPKFVALRKVMKDVLMDTRRVRLGLVTFNGNTGGYLQKGLNPSCNLVYPPSPSNFDSNRSSVLGALKAVNFNNSTPLAEALLNVGEIYRTPTLTWFSSTYRTTTFENAAGVGNQAPICFNCQKSSVIVITDGLSNYDDTIPGTDFAPKPMTLGVANATGSYAGMAGYNIKDISDVDCPLCNTDAEAPEIMPDGQPLADCGGVNPKKGACGGSGAVQNYLPKVAWYLHHMDFRTDTESGSDAGKMAGHQGVDVYTVGYGLGKNAQTILEHAAYRDPASRDKDVGGGLSRSANNVAELKQAILDIYEDVNSQSTSFGSASVATLQATAAIGTLVPRFDPNKTAHWAGHLYDFRLFSEFSAGCKPTIPGQPLDPNDKDCDRDCRSIFLQDADGSFIQENNDGLFVKNAPANLPACGPSNKCTSCAAVGTASARPVWEAGEKLAAVAWRNRRAFTAVDSSGDGKLDGGDETIPIRDDDATAKALLPYVSAGGGTCTTIATLLAQTGNTADAKAITDELALATRQYTSCVRTMIRYLLGADVFDADSDGDFRDDRPTKLGDMFHSSPIPVYPPFARSALLGGKYPDQYLPTLSEGRGNPQAYDDYADRYRERDRLVVVGANDGFLHAFRVASFRPGDDPATSYKVEKGWFDDALGGGDEEWAFMPPDLLPKLPLLLANLHQFYVDATPFVRDVWVDENQDDVHQEDEFHTVLVCGERRGGSHYFALDVTKATFASNASQDPDAKPEFLWIYPQPGSPESLAMGESFLEAFPAPPTIGPVRIDARADYAYGETAATQAIEAPDGSTVPFHERWITFLSGGFDMSLARGHGLYMVDVWTGQLVWDFAQPARGSLVDPTDPRWELRFPFAATIGMVGYGKDGAQLAGDADTTIHIFDTASVGDLGGQLWIMRFFQPGRIGASGKVENWFGARLFQGGRAGCSTACLGQPIFSITANIVNNTDGSYRILVGTGDRFNLLDTSGGMCGPDNVRACLLQGCTVALKGTTSIPASIGTYTGEAAATLKAACFPMDNTVATAAGSCSNSSTSTQIAITACPNPDPTANDVDTTFALAASCTPENETFACTPAATNDEGVKLRLLNAITQSNRFYSLLVWHKERRPIFNDLEGAKKYDAARLTETSPTLAKMNASALVAGDTAGDRVASLLDDGWYRYFTHTSDVVINGTTYSRVALDERVVGAPTIYGGRVFFNTLQPLAAVEATSKSPCKPNRVQFSYLYGAMITTGAPGLTDDSGLVIIREIERRTPVPPQPPIEHVFVNPEGQVMVGLVSQPVGGPPTNLAVSGVEDPSLDFGWIGLDPRLHECRHRSIEASCASY